MTWFVILIEAIWELRESEEVALGMESHWSPYGSSVHICEACIYSEHCRVEKLENFLQKQILKVIPFQMPASVNMMQVSCSEIRIEIAYLIQRKGVGLGHSL